MKLIKSESIDTCNSQPTMCIVSSLNRWTSECVATCWRFNQRKLTSASTAKHGNNARRFFKKKLSCVYISQTRTRKYEFVWYEERSIKKKHGTVNCILGYIHIWYACARRLIIIDRKSDAVTNETFRVASIQFKIKKCITTQLRIK